MNLNSREIRRLNIKSFFNRCYPWRCCRCCLNCFWYLGSERLHALLTICLFGCQAYACVWAFVCFTLVCLLISLPFIQLLLGSLSKPRRQRQRKRRQTKGLTTKTIAVHVRYKPLYVSLPSSARKQREMTKVWVFWRTWATTADFSYFLLELFADVTSLV